MGSRTKTLEDLTVGQTLVVAMRSELWRLVSAPDGKLTHAVYGRGRTLCGRATQSSEKAIEWDELGQGEEYLRDLTCVRCLAAYIRVHGDLPPGMPG